MPTNDGLRQATVRAAAAAVPLRSVDKEARQLRLALADAWDSEDAMGQ